MGIHRRTAQDVHVSRLMRNRRPGSISDRELLTFVFFIRHLSHAFHTRLCLPSAVECVEELSGERGECTCECVEVALLARLEIRCADLADLAPELLFLMACTLIASSVGGLGRLRSITSNLVLTPSELRCDVACGKIDGRQISRVYVVCEGRVSDAGHT